MREFKMDLLCVAGAATGFILVPIVALACYIVIGLLLAPEHRQPLCVADPSLPSDRQMSTMFVAALAIPILAMAGTLSGWAWTVRVIRRKYPSYEIL